MARPARTLDARRPAPHLYMSQLSVAASSAPGVASPAGKRSSPKAASSAEPEDDDKAVRTSEEDPALAHQTRLCMRRLLALLKSLPQLSHSKPTAEGTATATAATAVLPSARGCVAPAPASIAPTSRGKFGGGRC